MLRSEIAFIPNNLSSHSLHMTNFIEEEANEDNSQPKSSNPSKKKEQQEEISENKHSSFMQERSGNSRGQKMANEIQDLQSRLQVKNSVFDTPINLFNRPVGKYEFTSQAFPSEQQLLVQEITNQLNQIERSEKPHQVSQIKAVKKQKAIQKETPKKLSIDNEMQEIKVINPLEEVDTDYSDISRDVKIYEHRYQSNLAYLSDQTKELLTYYQFMIQQQEQRQLRNKIMMLQINNHRAKISLRNASYSKRFNFISPIPKNNDKPIQFKAKFRVEQHLVDRMEELERNIKGEQAVWEEQEARLTLLTKYYNIIKSRTIPNLQQSQADFKYDSKLERYTKRQDSFKNSTIAIDVAYTTNNFNITPASSLNTTNNLIRKSPALKKGITSPQKRTSPKKLATTEITEPYQKYNLLRYKTEISKEMMLEYEVYNLGRLKRIKDENRMIKKELQFIDEHIQHFDKSFAEELKKYQEKQKPKITYQSFQTIQQDTPFTKSPWSRDYLGNSKGCNTINLYRPDSKEPKLLKSTSNSKHAINKSLSQSKYTIKRDQTINMSSSRRDITLSQNLLTQNDRTSEKSDTVVSFFRNKVNSPEKSKPKDNCIYTNRKQLVPIKEKPLNHSKKSLSQRSLSPRSKNLLRFNYQSQTQQSIGKRSIKSPKLRMTENRQKYETPSKKLVSSQYCLSPDQDTSKN